jgi:transcription antitermination factor NusG
MPLLPRESDLSPDDFFSLSDERFPWGVAHTRSRQEKRLARLLAEHGVPFYLPQFASERARAGRSFTSYLPLFPGYLFFRGRREERDHIVRSNLVANLIDVADAPTLAAELSQIRALQLAGASLRPFEPLVLGDPVRVREGAFSGYRGVVMREKGHDRLVVLVALINRAVTVEFQRDMLVKAHVR